MRLIFSFAFSCILIFSDSSSAKNITLLELSTPFNGSTLYVPNDGKIYSGIVMLHGSEGGSLPYASREAQFLAANGYAVLAFCWYNCLKNPILSPMDPLENVELRKTIEAIRWLKNSSYVKGGKIALLGWSRGGEQAVLLGSISDSINLIDAIAVHTPSDTVVSGFAWAGLDKRCWICTSLDLACFNASEDLGLWDWPNLTWNLACGARPKLPSDTQSWILDGQPIQIGQSIEIEKFRKPVFITVGDKDELWDHQKSVRIRERLESFGQPVDLHVFPGEFHNFSNANENKRHQLLINFLNDVL